MTEQEARELLAKHAKPHCDSAGIAVAKILAGKNVVIWSQDAVTAIMEAAQPAPSASVLEGWKSIDSAPKDKPVLLWQPAPFTVDTGDGPAFAQCAPGAYSGYWDSLDSAWCLSGATWRGPFLDPTHWLPLPIPPSHARNE